MSADLLVVIASGSRNWTDRELVVAKLEAIFADDPLMALVEGRAKGLDRIAGSWASRARARGVGWVPFYADWPTHDPDWCPGNWCRTKRTACLGAGSKRNQEMIDWALGAERQYVVAFKDGFDLSRGTGGTEDLVRRAKAAEIRGVVVSHPRVA